MSIPANALSDEECLHYAALDPAAAAELNNLRDGAEESCTYIKRAIINPCGQGHYLIKKRQDGLFKPVDSS